MILLYGLVSLMVAAEISQILSADALAYINHNSLYTLHCKQVYEIPRCRRHFGISNCSNPLAPYYDKRFRSQLFSSSPDLESSSTPSIIPSPNARYVAISALTDAAAHNAFSTRRLEENEQYQKLKERDRAFARLLVATVERRLGQIDCILKICIEKYPPKGKYSYLVQSTLRAGVAQLLFLNTPPFAANQETVQVLRIHHLLSPTKIHPVPEQMIKFVNGVLRKLSRPTMSDIGESNNGLSQQLLYGHKLLKENTTSDDNIASWLLQRWKNDWGEERANLILEEMVPSNHSLRNRMDISTKYMFELLVQTQEKNLHKLLKKRLEEVRAEFGDDSTLLPQGSIRIGSSLKGDLSQWPGYHDGTWWVQDASSTLPALVLIQALLTQHGSHRCNFSPIHIVDMCASPGGKTAALLSAGFERVTAVEASEKRSRRLIQNLTRLKLLNKCEIIVEEGQCWVPERNDRVHGILVDVPCSATGTGARQPDVLRREPNIVELLSVQEAIANNCADNILDKDGIMVYATCSILKEESENQVHKLIARGNNPSYASLETLPIQPHEVPGFEAAIDENGWLRVLPGILGEMRSTDGFFVARLVKK